MADIKLTSEIGVRLIQQVGSDQAVAQAAVVVEPEAYEEYKRTHPKHTTEGILRYMMQHRHGTPFEHSSLSFLVRAPIFVWREWHRHRIGFSYNEESARYKQLDPEFYIPPPDRPMFKPPGEWRPGKPKFLTIEQCKADGQDYRDLHYTHLKSNLTRVYDLAYQAYEMNLGMGFDPGLARDCLPVGIYSSCWVTCNPRSLMAFLSLRTHEPEAKFVSYPLYEIEVAARKCEALFAQHWPLTHKAFCDFGRCAP